jgi:hypothetical protein
MDLQALWPWVFWLSGVTFVGSLVVLPIVIIRMPADYFVQSRPAPDSWRARHPAIRFAVRLVKNLFGVVFLLAGLIMLVTPGQGLVSLLVGLSLLDIPGKRAWERRFVSYPQVHRVLNAIRAKAGQPPLELPPHGGHSHGGHSHD